MKAFDQIVIDSSASQYWSSSIFATTEYETLYQSSDDKYIFGHKNHPYNNINFVEDYKDIENSYFNQDLSGWSIAGAWSWSNDYAFLGSGSAKAELNSNELSIKTSNIIPVGESDNLKVELRLLKDFDSVVGNLDLVIENYIGLSLSSQNTIHSFYLGGFAEGSWVKLTDSYTIPSGIDGIKLKIVVRNNNTSGSIYIDNIRMRNSNTLSGLDQIENNRPICSEQEYSISLSEKLGLEIEEDVFSITMLILPGRSLGDLISVDCDGYKAGVRVVGNKFLELYGHRDGEFVSLGFNISNQTQYLHLSKSRNSIGVVFSDSEYSLEIDDSTSYQIFFGGVEDYLCDKIILSIDGDIFTEQDYLVNLISSPASEIYRPDDSSFGLVRNQNKPVITSALAQDFFEFEGSQYFTNRVVEPFSPVMINNQTNVSMEYSIDGEIFETFDKLLTLSNLDNAVTIKVNSLNAIEGTVFFTESPLSIEEILNFYDYDFSGPVYLGHEAINSYWANPDDNYLDSQISILNADDEMLASLNSIELLCYLTNADEPILDIDGQLIDEDNADSFMTIYINGKERSLDSLVYGHFYHIIFVLNDPAINAIVNPNGSKVNAIGLGASIAIFATDDIEYIWKILSGGKVLSESSTISSLEDGVSIISGEASAVVDLQWQIV